MSPFNWLENVLNPARSQMAGPTTGSGGQVSHCPSWDEESPGVRVPSSPPSQEDQDEQRRRSSWVLPRPRVLSHGPGFCPTALQAYGEEEEHTDLSQWPEQAGTTPSASTAQAGGSRRDGVPFWAQDRGKPAGSQTGVEVGKWAEHIMSPEGQVLGGPVFTPVALKGFRTHTLLKTHKLSHAESRFSPLFLDRHFPGLKRIYKAGCRHSTRLRTPPQ